MHWRLSSGWMSTAFGFLTHREPNRWSLRPSNTCCPSASALHHSVHVDHMRAIMWPQAYRRGSAACRQVASVSVTTRVAVGGAACVAPISQLCAAVELRMHASATDSSRRQRWRRDKLRAPASRRSIAHELVIARVRVAVTDWYTWQTIRPFPHHARRDRSQPQLQRHHWRRGHERVSHR
jgi:hypothetical protein